MNFKVRNLSISFIAFAVTGVLHADSRAGAAAKAAAGAMTPPKVEVEKLPDGTIRPRTGIHTLPAARQGGPDVVLNPGRTAPKAGDLGGMAAAMKEEQAKLDVLKGMGLSAVDSAALKDSPVFANATADDLKALKLLLDQKKASGSKSDVKDLIAELETVQGLKGAEGAAEQAALTGRLRTIRELIDADTTISDSAASLMQKSKDVASFEAALRAEGVDAETIKVLSTEFVAAKNDPNSLNVVKEKVEVALYLKKNNKDQRVAEICSLKGGACPCH